MLFHEGLFFKKQPLCVSKLKEADFALIGPSSPALVAMARVGQAVAVAVLDGRGNPGWAAADHTCAHLSEFHGWTSNAADEASAAPKVPPHSAHASLHPRGSL